MSLLQTDGTILVKSEHTINNTSDYELDYIDVQQIESFGFDIIWKNGVSMEGYIELLCSPNKVNWNKINGSTQFISGTTGHHTYNVDRAAYRYIKLITHLDSGTGVFSIWFNSRSRRN